MTSILCPRLEPSGSGEQCHVFTQGGDRVRSVCWRDRTGVVVSGMLERQRPHGGESGRGTVTAGVKVTECWLPRGLGGSSGISDSVSV